MLALVLTKNHERETQNESLSSIQILWCHRRYPDLILWRLWAVESVVCWAVLSAVY